MQLLTGQQTGRQLAVLVDCGNKFRALLSMATDISTFTTDLKKKQKKKEKTQEDNKSEQCT